MERFRNSRGISLTFKYLITIIILIPRSKGRKSDASLLAWRFLILGPAKNMSKKPFFAEKWADCECFWGLWEHAVRSNPVSKGSKDLLTPTSCHYNRYIVTIAVDSFQQEGGVLLEYIIAFLISIAAGIVCYYICKWLDRDKYQRPA